MTMNDKENNNNDDLETKSGDEILEAQKDSDNNSEINTVSEDKSESESDEETKSEAEDAEDNVIQIDVEKNLVTMEQMLPSKLRIVNLVGSIVYPGVFTPFIFSDPIDVRTIQQACDDDGYIGLLLKKTDSKKTTMDDMYTVGVVGKVLKKIRMPEGGLNVFISTIKRFKVDKVLNSFDPMVASVKYLDDEESDSFEVKALTRSLISEMKEICDGNPLISEEMRVNLVNIKDSGKITDFIASVINMSSEEAQSILELTNVRRRITKLLVFIKREQELTRLQKRIQNDLNEKIEKNQREYFLREEMKVIMDELGEGESGKNSEYNKFKDKIDMINVPEDVEDAMYEELEKFSLMDPSSSEYFISRNYLELITSLPWNSLDNESYNLSHAYKVLEKDHYGLDDVKKRIMEYLAIRKLKNDNKGSIIILVGPPGVGKTSIGHSIAKAMNKPFYRFSVGGVRDEAEIRGHRRTYVGAMPGKIIQGLKITKSKSPVFMIDEIDKMGSSYSGGDPASALLEVLDPEQNVTFRDTYLDLPFDVSNVFFILTANSLDKIPEPLLDRAEIISLSGYIDQEKLEIAKKYLIPKNLEKNGLGKAQVKYTKAALLRISQEYAREAGVRNYEKCLDKIHRKLVTQFLTGIPADIKKLSDYKILEKDDMLTDIKEQVFTIDAPDLDKYLGKPVFDESHIKKADVPGSCIGLAWTSMGGDTLLIESISFQSEKGGLLLTGQMGDVMKESAQIAMNWVKQYAIEHKIKSPSWFERNTIHLHIPEGATPKDGPSAGITMATTFMSLLTGRCVKPNVAMTGELDLTGHVMEIGGLREKTVAAKRNGIKTIFIPKANEKDLDDIPDHVKSGIKFIPVSHAMEVLSQVYQAPVKKSLDEDYGF